MLQRCGRPCRYHQRRRPPAERGGASAYASIEFNKYSTDERDNSRFHPQYNIYFQWENVHTGDIVSVGLSQWHSLLPCP